MTYGEYEDQPDPVGTSPKAVVVAWWDEDITDLARSLSIFLPRGSVVKVISAEKPEVGTERCACMCPEWSCSRLETGHAGCMRRRHLGILQSLPF